MLRWILALTVAILAAGTNAETRRTSVGSVNVDKMIGGLDTPWAIAFISDRSYLITERDGSLYLVQDGAARAVSGLPEVWAEGQGGLLDVAVANDFHSSKTIYLTFAEPRSGGAGTALATATLDSESATLSGLTVIFRQSDPTGAGRHFGSRIVEARDGTLFVSVGDRADRDMAQSLESYKGKILRVGHDGRVPSDNPFVGQGGALPEIWSYGHRNPQGMAISPDGRLWTVEHGPRGGDEVNTPAAGQNYGWPLISYGEEYSGGKVGLGVSAPGLEQPLHYWDPSIAPSSLMIYSGKLWPEWRGDLFVGSLKFDMISRLSSTGSAVEEVERLFEGAYPRIRDIQEAPDGTIWFLSENNGAAYRISPARR